MRYGGRSTVTAGMEIFSTRIVPTLTNRGSMRELYHGKIDSFCMHSAVFKSSLKSSYNLAKPGFFDRLENITSLVSGDCGLKGYHQYS